MSDYEDYENLAFHPQMPRCDIEELKAKLEQSEKVRDLQAEHACKLEKKLEIAVKALKELSNETLVTAGGGCYANTAYDRAQKALAKIKEIKE